MTDVASSIQAASSHRRAFVTDVLLIPIFTRRTHQTQVYRFLLLYRRHSPYQSNKVCDGNRRRPRFSHPPSQEMQQSGRPIARPAPDCFPPWDLVFPVGTTLREFIIGIEGCSALADFSDKTCVLR